MRSFFVAIVTLSLIIGGSSLISAGDLADMLPEELSPSELHRYMGEQKAEALERSRQARALAPASSLASGQTDYDVSYYDVTIRVNDTTEFLYGTVRMVAEATVNGLTSIDVDLHADMIVDAITAPSGALAFTRAGDIISITLDGSYLVGEQFDFDIQYHGHPVSGGFQAFSFGWHDGDRAISSLSEPYFARTWWPCKDRMDDKPDSIGIHIEVETSLYCASNGTLDSIVADVPGNSRTFHYTHNYPIATYLFSVAIAPFVVWEQEYLYNDGASSMPVIHHVYSDWYDYSLTRWGLTPGMISVLSESFGPYPFLNDKYGHANFNWGGGMEHQTVTSMVGSSFGFYWSVVVHELGHQWWGDMVTCKSWQDIWLNEGWASYSEAVYELATGSWSDYHTYMNYMDYRGGGTIWVPDTTNVYRIFNGGLSYDKAAYVIHMLRGVVGEEMFAAGIAAYAEAFRFDAATTADFKSVWEMATGVELDPFIDQWIYGEYYPIYNYYYMTEPSDTGGYDTYLVVRQAQTSYPQTFVMPVDFFFDYASSPDDTLTLIVDDRTELFKFNQPDQVNQIKLDPSDWILKDAYSLAWEMFIITPNSELSTGVQFADYLDTIEVRGGTGPNIVNLASGILPPGLSISNEGVISGIPTTVGTYSFLATFVNPTSGFADQSRLEIEVVEGPCCIGKVGDANGLGGDVPTIGDISLLIDMLFINQNQPECLAEADINQSGGPDPVADDITIGDISVLIDHLFISGVELPDCL